MCEGAEKILTGIWEALPVLSVLFAGVAAVAACLAARATKRAAEATEKTTAATKKVVQGRLFVELLRDYSSEDMRQALQLLSDPMETRIKDEKLWSANWLPKWLTQRKYVHTRGDYITHAKQVDRARRRVSHYFQNALQFYLKNEIIDQHSLRTICTLDGIRLFYGIVEWLEQAINPKYDYEAFDRLLEFCDKDDVKELIASRPPERRQPQKTN